MERAAPSLISVSLAFLDSGQYLSSGEGMFRRPSEGQSLISYLSEQDFGSCADLEKVREAAAACVYWRMYLTAGSVSYFLPWGGLCYGIACCRAVHRTPRLSSLVVSDSWDLSIFHIHGTFYQVFLVCPRHSFECFCSCRRTPTSASQSP